MKKLIPLLSLAATALAVQAAPVSPDEALTRALGNSPQTMRTPGAGYSWVLYTTGAADEYIG
ncbi:MAG: hypothetical protein K2L57_02205 [Muribaculaceae bacterium]|nr:hypothetical protein [Muribaculaceae bacterium]